MIGDMLFHVSLSVHLTTNLNLPVTLYLYMTHCSYLMCILLGAKICRWHLGLTWWTWLQDSGRGMAFNKRILLLNSHFFVRMQYQTSLEIDAHCKSKVNLVAIILHKAHETLLWKYSVEQDWVNKSILLPYLIDKPTCDYEKNWETYKSGNER